MIFSATGSSQKKTVFSFFPAPKFLRMPAVGVDISDESIKFIELKRLTAGLALGRFGKYGMPQNVISGGEVQKTKELVEVLREMQRQHKLNFIHASLPEEHAYVFQTRVPKSVRRSQIRNVLEFKLEENVPLSGAEAIFDYSVFPKLAYEEAAEHYLSQKTTESNISNENQEKESVPPGKESEKENETKHDSVSDDQLAEDRNAPPAPEIEEKESSSPDTHTLIGSNESMVVGVSVYHREIVMQYVKAFQQAGMIPLSFEIETQASARSVVPRGDKGTCMVVDFGRSQAGLSIVHSGNLAFTATLNVGGDDLNRAIQKTFSVSLEEAERMKNEKGFINSEKNKELFVALISTVSAFKDELNKHYVYWHTHEDEVGKRKAIDKIFLCGGNANLPGLPEYLTVAMGVPVVRADVWTNVLSLDDSIPVIDFRHSLEYATTIGLALKSLY